jgi:hypothetical protein
MAGGGRTVRLRIDRECVRSADRGSACTRCSRSLTFKPSIQEAFLDILLSSATPPPSTGRTDEPSARCDLCEGTCGSVKTIPYWSAARCGEQPIGATLVGATTTWPRHAASDAHGCMRGRSPDAHTSHADASSAPPGCAPWGSPRRTRRCCAHFAWPAAMAGAPEAQRNTQRAI